MSAESEPALLEAAQDALVVYVTAPSVEVGAAVARSVVGDALAACCNVVPGVRSIYRWKGELCEDAEVLLVFKTRRSRLGALTERVVAEHPYDCPEVMAMPVEAGHGPYLAWIAENTV
jgi:periplasmic divalent cation tolerance protein